MSGAKTWNKLESREPGKSRVRLRRQRLVQTNYREETITTGNVFVLIAEIQLQAGQSH